MAWKTLDEAAAAGPSRATWERRIEHGRVPHYLDHGTGRRLVWVESGKGSASDDDLRELLEQVAGLSELVRELRGKKAATARPLAPKAPGIPGPRAKLALRAPVPSGPRRRPESVVSEAEVGRIMALRADCPLGDKALQRAAGLASNWFWKVKRGHCRSALALEGWRRLEVFLAPAGAISRRQTGRRAA